jgi:hypothetical protein
MLKYNIMKRKHWVHLFFCGNLNWDAYIVSKYDLHYPLSQLTVFQKGTYYAGIKVFNSLPAAIKELSHNIKQFKLVLKNFLRHSIHWMNILNIRIKSISMF